MKRNIKIGLTFVTLAAMSALLTGCKKEIEISLDKETLTLTEGKAATLVVTTSEETPITWSSENTSVATVNNEGLVYAVSEGTTTITALAVDYNQIASCVVTVNKAPEFTISLDKTTLSLVEEDTSTLTATISELATVLWSSSDENVVTVGFVGTTVTVTAVGEGRATITATANGKSATCAVNVAAKEKIFTITLDYHELTIVEGKRAVLKATTSEPARVTWSTDKDGIVNVLDGVVTAIAPGEVNVTASANGKSDTCKINVTPKAVPALSSISIEAVPEEVKTFTTDDEFSHEGVVVVAYYTEDKASENVSDKVTFSTPDMSVVGSQTITVSYTYEGIERTATYQITITQGTPKPVLDSIELDTNNAATSFSVGDTFSHEGVVVTAHYTEGKVDAVVTSSATFSSPDMSTAGQKTVTVTYTEGGIEKTATYQITVSNVPIPKLDSIELNTTNAKKDYVEGNTFSHEGVVVTAHYTEGKADENVTAHATFSSPDMSVVANPTITVSYTENGVTKTGTYQISVVAFTMQINKTSIELTEPNEEYTLKVTTNDNSKAIQWSSDHEDIAIVTPSSTQYGFATVVAKGEGTATITATSYGRNVTCEVSVEYAPEPSTPITLSWGSTKTLANITDLGNGNEQGPYQVGVLATTTGEGQYTGKFTVTITSEGESTYKLIDYISIRVCDDFAGSNELLVINSSSVSKTGTIDVTVAASVETVLYVFIGMDNVSTPVYHQISDSVNIQFDWGE